MKSLFSGFYTPTEEEFKQLWNECTFVFDANALLNLYRYSKESRDLLFLVMELIKDRMWIPHQIALEYHKHMLDEIHNQKIAYSNISNQVKSAVTTIEAYLKDLRHSNIMIEKISGILNDAYDKIEQELDSQKSSQPDLDRIRDKIDLIFDNKIGQEYTQEKLDEIYKQGAYRYENDIPPGHKDKGKGTNSTVNNGLKYIDKYGDLIFWLQILDKSKEKSVKSVILITDDKKEDWVYIIKGERKGPQPELVHEFMRETGGKRFYLYNTEQFLKYANRFLKFPDETLDTTEIDKAIENVKTTKELLNELQGATVVDVDIYKKEKYRQRKLTLFGYMAILRVNEEVSPQLLATIFISDLTKLTGGDFVTLNVFSNEKDEIVVHFRSSEILDEDIVEKVNKTLTSNQLLLSNNVFRVLKLFPTDNKTQNFLNIQDLE
ncbi:PIN-like domain-containing protein [Paenibacillus sp. DYY-L-2]|uniref:PIN-like domain-containing protein n=1 Tax=Paenibacillus sp. DYY-L-2 TaxID=3447013 RepID=UPI003F50C298